MTQNLRLMTEQVVRHMQAYSQTGTKPWSYETALKDLPVQVGSLTKLLMQWQGERLNPGMTENAIKMKIADELSDILSLVLYIAHELAIDIEEAWETMLKSDQDKFKERNLQISVFPSPLKMTSIKD